MSAGSGKRWRGAVPARDPGWTCKTDLIWPFGKAVAALRMGSRASAWLRFLEAREVQAGAKLLGLVCVTGSHDGKGTKASRGRGERGRVPALVSAEQRARRRFRCLFWESPLPLVRPGGDGEGGCAALLPGSLVQSVGGYSVLTVAFSSSFFSDRNC